MRFANLVSRLSGLSPTAQGFWAGHEGIGRGRGPRLAGTKSSVPSSAPSSRDIERAVEEGRIIEVGSR